MQSKYLFYATLEGNRADDFEKAEKFVAHSARQVAEHYMGTHVGEGGVNSIVKSHAVFDLTSVPEMGSTNETIGATEFVNSANFVPPVNGEPSGKVGDRRDVLRKEIAMLEDRKRELFDEWHKWDVLEQESKAGNRPSTYWRVAYPCGCSTSGASVDPPPGYCPGYCPTHGTGPASGNASPTDARPEVPSESSAAMSTQLWDHAKEVVYHLRAVADQIEQKARGASQAPATRQRLLHTENDIHVIEGPPRDPSMRGDTIAMKINGVTFPSESTSAPYSKPTFKVTSGTYRSLRLENGFRDFGYRMGPWQVDGEWRDFYFIDTDRKPDHPDA